MSDTIECAARAIAGVIAPIIKRSTGGYAGLTQEDLLDAARAAISAIREPDDAMLDQGVAVLSNTQPDEWVPPSRVWSVMIDAALRE